MGAIAELGALFVAGAALVLLLFVGIRTIARGVFGNDRRLERTIAMEVLDGRLARGEITPAEYEQAKRALGGP